MVTPRQTGQGTSIFGAKQRECKQYTDPRRVRHKNHCVGESPPNGVSVSIWRRA